MSDAIVKILKWADHNPRKDLKHPRWFALSNRVIEDAKLFALSSDEFKAFVYILCQASQKNSDEIDLYFDHAIAIARIPADALVSAIAKLSSVGVLQHVRKRTQSVRARTESAPTLHNTTLQNRTKNNAHAEAFAIFWAGYPRKVGKGKTESLFLAALKAGVPAEEIMQAQNKYKEQLKKDGTEAKYILHGPSFMGRWRDFLDPDYGKADSFAPKKKTILEVLEGAK